MLTPPQEVKDNVEARCKLCGAERTYPSDKTIDLHQARNYGKDKPEKLSKVYPWDALGN